MYRFFTTDQKKLTLGVDRRGISFTYLKANGNVADVMRVDQDWTSINSIISKLRKKQKYCAGDHSLLVWKQGEELYVKLRCLDLRLEETLTFSKEMTDKFTQTLEGLPCLN